MKFKKLCSVFLLSALVLTGCSNANETSETSSDVQGESTANTTQTQEETQEDLKVVAATVSGTQVLDKLDANVVGIPTTKLEIPEQYKGLPEVGQSMSPDLEIVASLEPDLFIMDSMFEENVKESMQNYDINTFFLDTGTYSAYIEDIKELGEELNKQEEATTLVNELKEVEKSVSELKKDKEVSVAIIFGSGENFMLATETSYLGDLAKTVGATNITTNLNTDVESPYIQFSLEQILNENPDYILRFAHGELEETKKAFDDAFDKNPAYKELDAVKNNKVFDLDPSIFNVSANLQVKDAITKLGEILYGN